MMKCPACGSDLPDASRYCAQCGEAVSIRAPRLERAERRQLTLLFCDMVGSTPLSSELDAEEYLEVVRRYQALVSNVVARHRGHLAQYLGDGVVVYFGYPAALEDGPRRAVEAGLEIVETIRTRFHDPSGPGVPLQVRIGIHTGMTVVDRVTAGEPPGTLALGQAPNLAARVQAHAEPDTVAVSEDTFRLAKGFFRWKPLGEQSLKGIPQPVPLYRPIERSGAQTRLDVAAAIGWAPIANRTRERGQLRDAWRRAVAGHGMALMLIGEPGLGKSRLVHFLKDIVVTDEPLIFECQCSPYHGSTALHPLIDALSRLLSLGPTLNQTEHSRESSGVVSPDTLTGAQRDALLHLVDVLGPDAKVPEMTAPKQHRHQMLIRARDALLGLAAASPLLFVVEDVHWADPTTIELLSMLSESVGAAKALAIYTARPETLAGWEACPELVTLRLERLPREDVGAIVAHFTGNKRLPDDIFAEIAERADGVPLFVEEVVKSVMESGLLVEAKGRFEATGPLPHDFIPPSIQDLLASRLDRLGEGRSLVQLAATLGREFRVDVLSAVAQATQEKVVGGLESLVAADVLIRGKSEASPTYAFRHALIHDAAYQTLLRSARQKYHRQVVETLSSRFPELAAAQPELLGHQSVAAAMPEQAVAWFLQAGQHATSAAAFVEAINHFTRAVEQLHLQPPSEMRNQMELFLRTYLGLALISVKGFAAAEVEDNYRRAQELCGQSASTPIEVLYGIWVVHLVRGDLMATAELAKRFATLADTATDARARIVAHCGLGVREFFQGNWDAAMNHFGLSIAAHDPSVPGDDVRDYALEGVLYSQVYSMWAEAMHGETDAAKSRRTELLELTRQAHDPQLRVIALTFGATVADILGEWDLCRAYSEEAVRISSEREFPFWLACSTCCRGRVGVVLGEPDRVEQLEAGIDALRGLGVRTSFAHHASSLIQTYLATDDLDRALALTDETLDLAENHVDRCYLPKLLSLKAEIQRRSGQLDTARALAERAVDAADRQGAVLMGLEARVTLARIVESLGDVPRARDIVRTGLELAARAGDVPPAHRARAYLAGH